MYDLAIIGLGAAGLEAAQIAIKNGLNVIAFEKNELGGAYLNTDSIPTRTIYHSSKLLKEIENSSKLGINLFAKPGYNWQIMLDRKIDIVNKFTKLLNSQLSKNLTLIKAEAELFINYDQIEIYADDNVYQAKNIIISTGATPKALPGLPYDGEFVINVQDMFKKLDLPKRIAIVGSSFVGLEWAYILSSLGCEVKLIEKENGVAPYLDIELQKRVAKILKTNKVQCFKNDFIVKVSNDQVHLNSGIAFDIDCILVAIGSDVSPCKISINGCVEPFIIKPEADGSCDIDNLYIIGAALNDNITSQQAQYQAKCVMNNILSKDVLEQKEIPHVISLNPEIATIGKKEQDIDLFDGYEIKKINISSLAQTWCDDASDGMIKVIIKDDILVGAHVVSKEASSLAAIFSILINQKIKISEIENMVFPFLNVSQAIIEVLKSE